MTEPAEPDVAAPDPRKIDPLFPALADPELKASSPLEPETPPFALPTHTAPLLVCVPSPLLAATPPPVAAVL